MSDRQFYSDQMWQICQNSLLDKSTKIILFGFSVENREVCI